MGELLDGLKSPEDIKKLTMKQLAALSEEMRQYIINCVSKNGGHLSSNLGVIELTVALHYVFNTEKDRIIWDVGHQSYAHKILTGRKDAMLSLRKADGCSGFPRIRESKHDAFGTGHSSTAISAALGMARARDISGSGYSVVAVVGDGSMTGGMCYEALNDAGHVKTPLIVVLNDNEMSIEQNVGGMTRYLNKLRAAKRYNRFKEGFAKVVGRVPLIGKNIVKAAEKLRNRIKYFIVMPGVIFEQLGFTYLGPMDGHDLPFLIEELKRARDLQRPVLLHVITKKGKGYSFAEDSPEKYHGIAPFYVETGEELNESQRTNSMVFAEKLAGMAARDKRIVAITAAMPRGTGLLRFQELFPKRYFDVGIAEEHAATMAAGLAAAGMRPYFAVYSTFLQRAYDQVLHDVCLQKLPVVFIIDRAGIVGEDGETHHGIYDISFLRHMPNITIMSPADLNELQSMMELSLALEGPSAIRYSRGCLPERIPENNEAEYGKWSRLCEGEDAFILATGRMVGNALNAADILKSHGIRCTVINARFIKPLDEEMLQSIAQKGKPVFTVEENTEKGGFGSAIGEYLDSCGIDHRLCSIGLPDTIIMHGSSGTLLDKAGLSSQKIAQSVLEHMGRKTNG
ncbi:MAG: 1-deoxy-D-xylulose-5-phosphate synthase [Bacillota bacterium]|nr:1-deoxy-D-xylulose-5-phosphate synthase [Bacillota bacterium]